MVAPSEVARLLGAVDRGQDTLVRLRAKVVDFERRVIAVREGKGNTDRLDRAADRPVVELPGAPVEKFPRADRSGAWFWLWPALRESLDPRSGCQRRHHRHADGEARPIATAARWAGLA
jgi:hypothetical protein